MALSRLRLTSFYLQEEEAIFGNVTKCGFVGGIRRNRRENDGVVAIREDS